MEEIKTIHVTINEDGTTSNGSIFSVINDEQFYFDHVRYVKWGDYFYVWGYDETRFSGTANIVSSVTYNNGKTYKILIVGMNAFEDCDALTSVNIPEGVTSIAYYAFKSCQSLTSIVIPESVTSIGVYAFQSCRSLTSVNIPNSVTRIENGVFSNCSALTSIDIPKSVTSIGDSAFSGCSSLTSIDIPENVTRIGYSAFCFCESLTTVICRAGNVPELEGDELFPPTSFSYVPTSKATLYVPASALEAYKAAGHWKNFGTILPIEGNEDIINSIVSPAAQESECPRTLDTIHIVNKQIMEDTIHVTINDDGTTSNASIFSAIDDENFYLNSIKYTIKKGYLCVSGHDKKDDFIGKAHIASSITYKGNTYEVLEVGTNAFKGCKYLTSVVIPNGVTRIGGSAFYDCYFYLKSVVIPNSVTSIGSNAFAECGALTSINIPESVTKIGKDAFSGCSSLTSIDIPDSVTKIGDHAFSECSSLTSINLPKNIKSIEEYTFRCCKPLTSIVIPENVTSIGDGVFSQCTKFTSIDIPKSVTSIGSDAFDMCYTLTTVICRAENVPQLGERTLPRRGLESATLYVPASALEAYKAAEGWKDFGTILPIEGNEDVISSIFSPAAQES